MKPTGLQFWVGLALVTVSASVYLAYRPLSSRPPHETKVEGRDATRLPASTTLRSGLVGLNAANGNSSVPATATATRLPPPELRQLTDEVERIQACYAGSCSYSQSYPRDYAFAVGRDLKAALYALNGYVERTALKDAAIAKLARMHLANEDGHVKEAALHLLASQPTSAENLASLLKDVIEESDAELIEHAMLELSRYKSPGDLRLIRESLAQAMLTGAPFVSEAVSNSIVRFIDNESYPYFSEIAARASPGSRVKTNLQFSLTEFRRRQVGA